MNRRVYLGALWTVTAGCILLGLYGNLRARPSYYEEEYTPSEEEYAPPEEGYAVEESEFGDRGLDPYLTISADGFLGEITIAGGEAYNWEYTPYNEEYPAEISYEGDGIVVRQQRPERNLKWADGTGGSLYITIPFEAGLRSVDLSLDYGMARLENIKAETLTVVDRMGSVELMNCTLGETNIDIDMGDLDAEMLQYRNFTANMDMGNANIHTVNGLADGEIDLRTDLGRVEYLGEEKGTTLGILRGDTSSSSIHVHNAMGNIVFNSDQY